MTPRQIVKEMVVKVTAILAVIGGAIMLASPSFAATTAVNLTAANQFDAANVTVGEGDTVTFTWSGGFHDVTFDDGVDSGAPVGVDGTTFSRTFDAAGTYNYVCTVHESTGMVGTVIVEAAATVTTVAPAETTATTAPDAGTTATTRQSNAPTAQPFTGPEDSVLPVAGVALVLTGLTLRLRLRRTG